MSNFMRRHRRIILLGIIVFIGIPFVLFVPGFTGGGGGPGQQGNFPQAVAQVGDEPISAAAFRQEYDRISRVRAQQGDFPTAEEMTQDGTVERILESLINDALLRNRLEQRALQANRDYLAEMLKELPQFQTESGEFDAAYYNRWVETNEGANWNAIYEELNNSLNRQIFGSLLTASARVLEEDLREGFLENNTTIRIKYAAIEPKVELTEEEIRAHYEENQANYLTEEERVAEFVAISLQAPLPPEVDDILAKAHAGEDFAALARSHSEGPQKSAGGDLGWIQPTAALPDHQKVLLTMDVGEVSNPVEGPNGYHIYKVTDERNSTLAGRRDVRASQIVLRPQLDEDETQQRMDLAEAIAEAAKASGDLHAVAEAEGLAVQSTNAFSQTSSAIQHVDPFDTFVFRREVSTVEEGGVTDVIEGRKNLYVAKVTEVIEPRQQPFEAVRNQVERDAVAAYKQTPEYWSAVQRYVAEIEEKATSLEDIKELFPELEVEIKETNEPFARSDYLFQQGLRFQTGDVFNAVEGLEPGQMAGPITDFSQVTHFIELAERNEPDETAWEERWPEEKQNLRQQRLQQLQLERQEDYFQYLREKASEEYLIQEDWAAIAQIIDYGGAPAEGAGEVRPIETGDSENEVSDSRR